MAALLIEDLPSIDQLTVQQLARDMAALHAKMDTCSRGSASFGAMRRLLRIAGHAVMTPQRVRFGVEQQRWLAPEAAERKRQAEQGAGRLGGRRQRRRSCSAQRADGSPAVAGAQQRARRRPARQRLWPGFAGACDKQAIHAVE